MNFGKSNGKSHKKAPALTIGSPKNRASLRKEYDKSLPAFIHWLYDLLGPNKNDRFNPAKERKKLWVHGKELESGRTMGFQLANAVISPDGKYTAKIMVTYTITKNAGKVELQPKNEGPDEE